MKKNLLGSLGTEYSGSFVFVDCFRGPRCGGNVQLSPSLHRIQTQPQEGHLLSTPTQKQTVHRVVPQGKPHKALGEIPSQSRKIHGTD